MQRILCALPLAALAEADLRPGCAYQFLENGAHRYCGSGEPMSSAEQVRDSNDFPGVLAELWAPVGLRYHAMHHLFPQLP